MSEPRFPTRVGDPDETTRIPKEALEGLRDADKNRDAARSAPGSSGSSGSSGDGAGQQAVPPAREAPKPANGSPAAGPPGAGGFASDGAPVVPPGTSRPPLFGTGGAGGAGGGRGAGSAGPNGSGGFRGEPAKGATAASGGPAGPVAPPAPPAARAGSLGSAGMGSTPAASSPIGYPERSQTGYTPAAYQGSFSSAYPSVADPPTTVAGRGGPVAAGAGLGATAAARSSLGAAGRPSPAARGHVPRPPRRARLLVRHIDPWSTLKFSFVLSVAMFFVWLVAVGVLYGVLDGMGVFEQINGLYDEVSGNTGDRLFSPGLVLGSATVVGAVNIVLFTALATIGAFVYNICSDLVGGIEVTLAERD
jgi:hypothetical protein